jgi:hypothetical protein
VIITLKVMVPYIPPCVLNIPCCPKALLPKLSDNSWPGYNSPITVPVPKAIYNPILNVVDLGCFAIFFIILDFINIISIM